MLREGAVAQQVTTKRSGVMAGLATALSDPNDILFFSQSIHIADGIGCCLGLLTAVWVRIDRSVLSLDILAVRRWLTARYVKRLMTVSATTCGSNRFSKEKNGWRPARR
ncbi:hypothetical protein [Klebsiella michiganensis]|uniref:hypothetical protein n=1 Tax=Klebsiella michiganensis TaxID=1134687 RepID=UPI001E332D91|nr:hypothetical protein [Klebsiella michiganensis]